MLVLADHLVVEAVGASFATHEQVRPEGAFEARQGLAGVRVLLQGGADAAGVGDAGGGFGFGFAVCGGVGVGTVDERHGGPAFGGQGVEALFLRSEISAAVGAGRQIVGWWEGVAGSFEEVLFALLELGGGEFELAREGFCESLVGIVVGDWWVGRGGAGYAWFETSLLYQGVGTP